MQLFEITLKFVWGKSTSSGSIKVRLFLYVNVIFVFNL